MRRLLPLLLLGSCGDAAWHDPYLGIAPRGETIACATSDECVLVQTTCCGVCAGGHLEAVNRRYEATFTAANKRECAVGETCPDADCFSRYDARCDGARCRVTEIPEAPDSAGH